MGAVFGVAPARADCAWLPGDGALGTDLAVHALTVYNGAQIAGGIS